MKILVNALPLMGLLTGISRYVRQLYTEIEKLPDTEVFYFDGAEVHRHMPAQAVPQKWIRTTAFIWKLPAPIVFMLRTVSWLKYEWMLRRVCRSGRYDIYHETAFVPAAMSVIPTIYTIHDPSLITHKQAHPAERVWFNHFFQKKRLPYATHIMTVSNYIHDQIIHLMDMPRHKVTVIPEAAAPYFHPRSSVQILQMRHRLSLPEDYLLFVGSMEPRKNLPMLIDALKRCKTRYPLVIAGWEGWGDKNWLKSIAGTAMENRIIMTGYVDDETLARLYSSAAVFIYPSLYEGFGLPILEAMACGCPVICSNVSSMPEVAGTAALTINPNNSNDLAKAIDRVLTDEGLRNRLIASGIARSSRLTWRKTAESTCSVFRKVISEANRK